MKGFVADIIRMVVISLVISAFFTGCQWLLSLASIFSKPTWERFWWGALGIFALWSLATIIKTIVYLVHFMQDPRYYEVYKRTGMDWKTYKRFRDKNK